MDKKLAIYGAGQDLENLLEKFLLETPEKIKQFQINTLSLNKKLEDIKMEIEEIETRLRFEVLTKVDENNKKIFTNQEMRDYVTYRSL